MGATLIGEVNDSSTLRIVAGTETILEGAVNEFQDAWKGAIPCLLK